ncbi:putative autophagy-related protein 11 [Drosophila montana]|uniref:putative autophagy-related protein 11 n=1 Tax=Drosophila montana TaxID=40370 RepID=UPI00313D50C9
MFSIKLNVKFLILFIYALVQICCGSVPAKNLSCAADKELDKRCETYCYRVVKPLLQHASDAYLKEQEFTKLLAKVQQQEIIIKSIQADQAILQAKLDAQNHSLTLCNDLLATKDALIEYKNADIKELQTKQENITKTMQVVQHNFQAKVDAQNHSLTSCKGQLAEKDALIENKNSYIKELQTKQENITKTIQDNLQAKVDAQNHSLTLCNDLLATKDALIECKNADIKELQTKQENITKTMQVVQHNFQAKVDDQNHSLTSCKGQLAEKDALIENKNSYIKELQTKQENITKTIQDNLQAKVDAQNHSLTLCNDLLATKDALIECKNADIKELQTKQENITKTMQVVQHNFQAKVDAQNHSLTSCKGQLAEKDALIENKNSYIKELQTKQENITKTIQDNLQAKVDAQNHSLTLCNDLLATKDALIECKNADIKELQTKQENITKTIQDNLQAKVDAQNHSLTLCNDLLATKDALIECKNADIKELQTKQENITKTMQVVQHNFQAKVDAQNHSLTSCKGQLAEKDALIENKNADIKELQTKQENITKTIQDNLQATNCKLSKKT